MPIARDCSTYSIACESNRALLIESPLIAQLRMATRTQIQQVVNHLTAQAIRHSSSLPQPPAQTFKANSSSKVQLALAQASKPSSSRHRGPLQLQAAAVTLCPPLSSQACHRSRLSLTPCQSHHLWAPVSLPSHSALDASSCVPMPCCVLNTPPPCFMNECATACQAWLSLATAPVLQHSCCYRESRERLMH